MKTPKLCITCIVTTFLLWHYQPAAALLVTPVSANDTNTSAPADDPGWLNVGDNGVYLGNGWVLTAFHVGPIPITFPGIGTYLPQFGTQTRIANPAGSGLSTYSELQVYRLTTMPPLPALSITTSSPAVDANVTLIGDGAAVTSAATETHWSVTGTSPDFTWTEVPSGGDASGYKSTTNGKRWGTNLVENGPSLLPAEPAYGDHDVAIDIGNGATITFLTEFDKAGETEGPVADFEAQGMDGDSASAIFEKVGGVWKLAGLTYAVEIFEDQPWPPGSVPTAVYGNLTLAADLSQYFGQINSITGIPEVGSFWLVGAASVVAGLLAGRRFQVSRGPSE